jgi:hypothetical protein
MRQGTYYSKHAEEIKAYYREYNEKNRQEINQKQRDLYWIRKTGKPWNLDFIKYILKLLEEDK